MKIFSKHSQKLLSYSQPIKQTQVSCWWIICQHRLESLNMQWTVNSRASNSESEWHCCQMRYMNEAEYSCAFIWLWWFAIRDFAAVWAHVELKNISVRLVTWRSFLTSRAQALAGEGAGQGAELLVASDCVPHAESTENVWNWFSS